jgi:hypothetical protein
MALIKSTIFEDKQLKLFQEPVYMRTDFDTDSMVFKNATGVKFPLDGWATAIKGRKTLDVLALDVYLGRKYKDSYPEGMSMNDFIRCNFGDDIMYIVNKWS